MKEINEYLINKNTKHLNYLNAVDNSDFDYALVWGDTVELYTKEFLKSKLDEFLKSNDPDDEEITMALDDLLSIKEIQKWKNLSGPVFMGDLKYPLGMKLR